jgi:hypothetical protein
MTSLRTTVYWCDEDGCEAVHIGPINESQWIWLNEQQHYCPQHKKRPCSQCGVATRPTRAKSADWPGTRKAYSMHPVVCINCHRGSKRPDVTHTQARIIRRLVEERLEDPDERFLVLDTLGLIGADID